MYDAEHVIAVGDRIDDDAERAQVKYTIDIELLRVHFSVNAVNMLYAAVDRDLKSLVVKAFLILSSTVDMKLLSVSMRSLRVSVISL